MFNLIEAVVKFVLKHFYIKRTFKSLIPVLRFDFTLQFWKLLRMLYQSIVLRFGLPQHSFYDRQFLSHDKTILCIFNTHETIDPCLRLDFMYYEFLNFQFNQIQYQKWLGKTVFFYPHICDKMRPFFLFVIFLKLCNLSVFIKFPMLSREFCDLKQATYKVSWVIIKL